MTHHERQRGAYVISTDRARLDARAIHAYLSRSYWATGIPESLVERSIQNSLCFGLFQGVEQVGFAAKCRTASWHRLGISKGEKYNYTCGVCK